MSIKTERMSLRLTEVQQAVLRRAAQVRGESTNEYVLRHAVEAAETELADLRTFVVNENEWAQVETALSGAEVMSPAMVMLLTRPSVLD